MANEEIEINECNEKCKGCYYFQEASLFCNYPFKERKIGFNFGMDIGTHECTAYGNKFYKPKTTVMAQEDKQLLLKDLCARLLYGVKCYVDDPLKGKLTVIPHSMLDMDGFECHTEDWEYEQFYSSDELTPYLRPLSSMTTEEFQGLHSICPHAIFNQTNNPEWIVGISGSDYGRTSRVDEISRFMDWLNAHHFDYRGLIEKGLALEAPEGMYKID